MWPIKKYGRLALVCILSFVVLLTGCGKTGPVVAKYDEGKVITEPQFKNYTEVLKAIEPSMAQAIDSGNKEALTAALHYMVMTLHVTAQVKETDEMKKEAEKNFTQYEDFVKQQIGQDKKLTQYYADRKVTQSEMKDFFLDQVKMISYFSKDVKEEDKKKEYDMAKKEGYLTQTNVRHILISTEKRSKAEAKKKADELVKQLRNGADFAKLAKENTDDPGTKETGGLYELPSPDGLTLEGMVGPFKNAAKTLPLNKISDPIETEFGYHIMRVEKRQDQPYDEVKKDITRMLAQEKENEFFTQKVKGIIKEEKIPADMIKEQPQQQIPGQSEQPGQSVPGTQQPMPVPEQPQGGKSQQPSSK
ncbi:peptidylprolyl isomerase [Aneurinibacillus aneurinilyticus]|jgi:foldase protein PrsA|uniref:PpiC domain-containing protein n=2 Tax=Aneurinibacillus aneurinilyticus TaxID=1391 RepID=A0A848CXA8_ANEAE|nr:peptidylprolyl isomerase [Aneurinibacillus aneurinilyticus]ERI08766.1 PPIC-type PPIASE domain protein [Aneurinibacillus aneurinilyticus ATCC 12856]MCI1695331.1 peptidylprolyl isomerase [Aneurinibacillus aneurinilyticus]MED0671589.1 peptidylprolyl isomerase [Aneurinibacillus aneurinilyticus]MED0706881.1 peptidylprolyl isomerase [Aneurinibacillus aneurinilyticus]MED0723384.1 peptidylprolyl isomerase [Aneurinibacillus aneurinilyticus]